MLPTNKGIGPEQMVLVAMHFQNCLRSRITTTYRAVADAGKFRSQPTFPFGQIGNAVGTFSRIAAAHGLPFVSVIVHNIDTRTPGDGCWKFAVEEKTLTGKLRTEATNLGKDKWYEHETERVFKHREHLIRLFDFVIAEQLREMCTNRLSP